MSKKTRYPKIEQVKRWLRDFVPQSRSLNSYVEIVEDQEEIASINIKLKGSYREYRFTFNIYTQDNRYHVVAVDKPGRRGYLGCQVSDRKPLAGENHHRGSDLPDGPLDRKTWDRIKDAIIRNELKPLSISASCKDGVIKVSSKLKKSRSGIMKNPG